ncbi:OLC1v1035203C1 [Oldenlandia corymbosa var. corymbosa]|uniref:OLC1v1035203C1 n=1 Tax=Oldenlandia corymbosa var. corymbosa TaxID=529605 RepID=A0AAV1CTR5_OLDCO|nr:OLC1v1035203C1 [Oldenlandia corymbosa var. corymbosa]
MQLKNSSLEPLHDQYPLKYDQNQPFHELQKDLPSSTQSEEKKIQRLQSQIIGGDVEFDTPFGKRNTHTNDSYVGSRMSKMADGASRYVKRCLGGKEEDAIIFCGSGSTAAIKRLQEVMGISVPSIIREKVLKCLTKRERWVVFVGPYEHHSNILSWRRSLAEVIEIGLDKDGLIDMEALRLQLEFYKKKRRPMLGSFSACSNVTGIYSDTRDIARLLHQYEAFACFDFAASGPYVEIDMRSGAVDGYDAIFLSPHKFLGGPGSPGILLMNKALYHLSSSAPSTCGGGTVDFVNDFNEKDTLYTKDVEEREQAGTPAIIQKIRAALAFWTKEYIGHNTIERLEHAFITQALERLLPNPNIKILGNVTAKRQAILSFLIYANSPHSPAVESNTPDINSDHAKGKTGLYLWRETGNQRNKPLHGGFISKLLSDLFGIQARGGCACAAPYGHALLGIGKSQSLSLRSGIQMGYNGLKPGWTRVSFPYYMSKGEFEFVLSAIEFVAKYGQRFLPLYNFNWKTGAWSFKKTAFKEVVLGQENISNLDVQVTTLSNMMEDLSLPCNFSDEKNHGNIAYYSKYLESARYIADILPKFPPQSPIPREVDPGILYFQV